MNMVEFKRVLNEAQPDRQQQQQQQQEVQQGHHDNNNSNAISNVTVTVNDDHNADSANAVNHNR
jgi:hypothetical protein